MTHSRLVILALTFLLASGCGTTQPPSSPPSPVAARADSLKQALTTQKERTRLRHPNLDATLWGQTAVEYDGVTVMMERALADPSWTAGLEQAERPPAQYRNKPPAVVLDVDETVLDNTDPCDSI